MIKEMKADKLNIKLCESRSELGAVAAADTVAAIKKLLAEKDEINMIFAAAPSQNEFLETLKNDKSIDFSRINAFHMDEYIGLSADAPQGFGNFLRDRLFGQSAHVTPSFSKRTRQTSFAWVLARTATSHSMTRL